MTSNAALSSFVERIERLEEEKRALAGDIRELYVEAKHAGFAPKIMREVVRERRMKAADARKYPALMAAAREGQPPDIPRFLDRRGAA